MAQGILEEKDEMEGKATIKLLVHKTCSRHTHTPTHPKVYMELLMAVVVLVAAAVAVNYFIGSEQKWNS